MTNNTTHRPTINRINEILAEFAGLPGMARTADLDGLTYEDMTLTAEAIYAFWDQITPDNNEGYIDDPEVAVVNGAIMGNDLWI
jgi:hypothetical protein